MTTPATTPLSTGWMDRAACRGAGSRLFLSEYEAEVRRAKVICQRCQVRETCLAYAVADPTIVGVWGGTTTSERRVMRGRVGPSK